MGIPGTGVLIQRCRIQADAAQRRAALQALDQAGWPAEDAPAYVLLRRVEVTAEPWRLGELSARAATALALSAVSGWSAAADSAPAVRFADLADLLACLSRDLLRGVAERRWFWRSWRQWLELPVPEALTRLWSEHPHLVPSLVEPLHAERLWAVAVPQFSSAQIARLLQVLAAASALARPGGAVAAAADSGRPRLPAQAVRPWQGLLQAAAPDAPLAQLAALLSAWTWAPQILSRPAQFAAWRDALWRQAADARPPDARDPGSAAEPSPPKPHRPGEAAASRRRPGPVAGPKTGGEAQGAEDAATVGPRRTPQASGPSPIAARPVAAASPTPGTRAHPAAPGLPPAARAAAGAGRLQPAAFAWEGEFRTAQGGLFYLLNVLNLPLLRRLLQHSERPGWYWLYRLGLSLQLDGDPPLQQFLAAALQLESPAALSGLPGDALEAELLRQIERRLADPGVWNPALLAVPARVRYTPSHIDVFMHLDSIRLEVRRAGLDIDPGWLPWLGRVVAFHYGRAPELQPPPAPQPPA